MLIRLCAALNPCYIVLSFMGVCKCFPPPGLPRFPVRLARYPVRLFPVMVYPVTLDTIKKRGCFSPALVRCYISRPSGKRNRLIYSAPIAWAIFSRSAGCSPLRFSRCVKFWRLVPAFSAMLLIVSPAYAIAARTCLLVSIVAPFPVVVSLLAIVNPYPVSRQQKVAENHKKIAIYY